MNRGFPRFLFCICLGLGVALTALAQDAEVPVEERLESMERLAGLQKELAKLRQEKATLEASMEFYLELETSGNCHIPTGAFPIVMTQADLVGQVHNMARDPELTPQLEAIVRQQRGGRLLEGAAFAAAVRQARVQLIARYLAWIAQQNAVFLQLCKGGQEKIRRRMEFIIPRIAELEKETAITRQQLVQWLVSDIPMVAEPEPSSTPASMEAVLALDAGLHGTRIPGRPAMSRAPQVWPRVMVAGESGMVPLTKSALARVSYSDIVRFCYLPAGDFREAQIAVEGMVPLWGLSQGRVDNRVDVAVQTADGREFVLHAELEVQMPPGLDTAFSRAEQKYSEEAAKFADATDADTKKTAGYTYCMALTSLARYKLMFGWNGHHVLTLVLRAAEVREFSMMGRDDRGHQVSFARDMAELIEICHILGSRRAFKFAERWTKDVERRLQGIDGVEADPLQKIYESMALFCIDSFNDVAAAETYFDKAIAAGKRSGEELEEHKAKKVAFPVQIGEPIPKEEQ